MKNRKEIHQYIIDLEQKYPVNNWKINQVHIWPYIRIKLSTLLTIQKDQHFVRKPLIASENQKTKSRRQRFLESKKLLKKLKHTDFIFTNGFSHRAIFDNLYYNKFYDPLVNDKIDSFIYLEHNSKSFYSINLNHAEKTFFFEDFHYSIDVISSQLKKVKCSRLIKSQDLVDYDNFFNEIEKTSGLNKELSFFSKKGVKTFFERLLLFVKTYEKILNATQPKAVFEVCYYSTNSMALNIASKRLGIPSVEIQHGPQPTIHTAYGNWNKIPRNGYEILPKIFWNWDQSSFNVIHNWAAKQFYHKSILNGNPWLSFFNLKKKIEDSNQILYSLQPFSNEKLFPKFLIDFIKSNPYKWILRVHPTDFNRISEIEQFLISKNIMDHVILDGLHQKALPLELANCFLHLTNSSGSAIEASLMNKKTIFIDPLSKEYFNELISGGMGYYAHGSNFAELVNKIKNSEPTNREELKTPQQMFDDLLELIDKN